MAAADVDEIWAEMLRDNQPSKNSKKVQDMDLSSLQRERAKPKKKASKKLDASLQWMQSWSVKTNTVAVASTANTDSVGFDAVKMTEPPSTLMDAIEEIPAATPETFLAYIQRDINCLSEENLGVRQKSLQKLERILVNQIDSLSTDIIDAVTGALLKPLLKRFRDKSEKCRECSVSILKSLIENTSDLSSTIGYVFPTLVTRLGAEDLDGVAHLPEVMRPNPEQKPTEIVRPVEESEEVRLKLALFVSSLLARCNHTQVLSYIDEATGLLRAQCMDPYHEVKAVACESMISFCHNHTEMLLHFSLPMGRSLTSCVTHPHARIRILALRAYTAIFWCGIWKHNHEIFQVLMAWQDPNQVAIKAFYEADTKFNYMSSLTFDRHPAVRRFWYETLAYWLLYIPDKVDHETYIFPYLLTGLCDENDEIALECFWLIEKCGELYEAEHEEDLRKTKQYGFDLGWTYNGRAFVPFPLRALWGGAGLSGSIRRISAHGPDMMGDRERSQHFRRDNFETCEEEQYDLGEEVALPTRDYAWSGLKDVAVYRNLPRPRLGSRMWVRTNTRRYIKATFNDVVDFKDCTAVNAGRLLCMSLAYTEEGVTEWLQPMFAALCKFYSGRAWAAGDSEAMQTYSTVCKLLGCFLDPISYWEQLRSSFDVDVTLSMDQRIANLKILTLCIEGSVETLKSVYPPDPTLGLGRLKKVIPELIIAMHTSDLLHDPSTQARTTMWALLFTFLEPLQEHLSFSQVSQLLFVALALAAKPAPEDVTELAGSHILSDIGEVVESEEEELVDQEKLERALSVLSAVAGTSEQTTSSFSLDDLDDSPPPPQLTKESDPRIVHKRLFELAFAEILEHLEDSFEVFRSVIYLSPVSVLTSPDHSETIHKRLASFCSQNSSSAVRSSSLALGVHLALRCAKMTKNSPDCRSSRDARDFMWNIFKAQGETLIKSNKDPKNISYSVMISGMLLWRRFLMSSETNPRDVLFSHDTEQPSKPLQWLLSIFVDQELNKRFHVALQRAETSHTGKEKDDFVILKSKQIREESELRSNVARVLAASTLLMAIRRLLQDSEEISWPSNSQPGSLKSIFLGVASLFRTAPHTIEPPFVRPTPATLTLYAAELLHLLHHLHDPDQVPPFRLRDDAEKAITQLAAPISRPKWTFELTAEEHDTLTHDFLSTLIDLNLTLPPDPNAKHAPITLSDVGDDKIMLGQAEKAAKSSSIIPREVTRLLSQSLECTRWNAALALYALGIDLAELCSDGLQRNIARWQRRGEQAKMLVCSDLMRKSMRARTLSLN